MKKIFNKIGQIVKPMLPNLPTDNLYKFLFVGSVFLMIFFTYNLIKFENDFSNKKFDLELKTIELEIENKNLEDALSFVTDIFNSNLDNDLFKETDKKLEELTQKKYNLDIKLKKNNALEEHFKYLEEKRLIIVFLYLLSILVFLTSSLISVCFWYNRVQKHEDRILRRNAG